MSAASGAPASVLSASASESRASRPGTAVPSIDQVPLMRRCGIEAFVVTHPATRKALESGQLTTVNLFYQPVGVTEVPVGTRPFLRRAAEVEPA